MSLATPKLRLKVLVLEVRPTLGSSLHLFSQPFKWRRGTPPLWPRSLWWAVGGTDSEIVWINAETYLIHLVEEREGNRLLVRTLCTHLQSMRVAHTHLSTKCIPPHKDFPGFYKPNKNKKILTPTHTDSSTNWKCTHIPPHTHMAWEHSHTLLFWPGLPKVHWGGGTKWFTECEQNVKTIKIVYDVYVSFIQDNNHYMYQIYSQSIQVFTWEWNEP